MTTRPTKSNTKESTEPGIYIAIPGCGSLSKLWTKVAADRVAKAIETQVRRDRGSAVVGRRRRCVSYSPKKLPDRNVDIELSYDQPLVANRWDDRRIAMMIQHFRKALGPPASPCSGDRAKPPAMALAIALTFYVCRFNYEYVPTVGGDLIVNYWEYQCPLPCDEPDNACQWVLVSSTIVHG